MGKIAIKTNATADISSILPEVLRFYDATATSTITLASGTNNITSWGDRSVNNIAATQTVGSEQPIYNPATGTGLRTINMSPIRNFLINFGTNAFSGTVYIADADHGVLDFAISVGANTILNVWTKANFQPRTSNAFLKVIGIVITSNPNHRSIIENYFGSKSQNLKYSNVISLQDFWITESNNSFFACRVSSFPLLNTQNVTNMYAAWHQCSSLTSFPLLNTRNVTDMAYAWQVCTSLTQLSLDNILISIATGFANNIGKTITNVVNIFATVPAILSHQNRRPEADLNETNTQDTISNWNTIIDSYLSNQITLTEMRNQHANAIDTYNTKWKTWEQALRNTNESLNGVQYNFSNGTVSGQKAYYWIVAKKSLVIPLGAAPTTLTTGVTRSYRSNSGLTVNGSNVNAWTPVTGTSNQTISGLTTQTINGITCVMFSSAKTITLNSISVTNTGNFVYIGTLYGYVKITPPTATNLRIESTNTTTELPIISIMVTTTAVNETEVLLRLGFYGSFQEFNYTANTLTSANIQLTAV